MTDAVSKWAAYCGESSRQVSGVHDAPYVFENVGAGAGGLGVKVDFKLNRGYGHDMIAALGSPCTITHRFNTIDLHQHLAGSVCEFGGLFE